jgi:murein tripeptide amidase MpaA
MIHFSSAFDGGNGELAGEPSDGNVRVRMSRDAGGRFMQWFYFRVSGARGTPLTISIENASESAYAAGWSGYSAVASSDRVHWLRVPTEYDGRALTIRHTPDRDAVWYAYFAPYSMERHADLIARCQRDARVESIAKTIDGQDLDCVRIGSGALSIWVIARQHPGETMAEWWAEGFLERVLEDGDPSAVRIRERATLHVVPNMNPDGSRRGYLRTNAAGTNLNRAWLEPTREASPEVFAVRERMRASGVDLCIDVHGDEEIPHNFVAGPYGVPSLRPRQSELVHLLRESWLRLSPDFQIEHGYPPAAPGQADLRFCTNYVAETFGCLAVTLEQPFKDTANRPSPRTGWSDVRAKRFGASGVDAIAAMLDHLR